MGGEKEKGGGWKRGKGEGGVTRSEESKGGREGGREGEGREEE